MARTMKERVRELTPRHREVVRLISLGCTTAEVATILGISQSTVDNHKHTAMRILGVNKAAILTRLAIKHRISLLHDQLTSSEKRKLTRGA